MLAQSNRWKRHFLAESRNAKNLVITGVVDVIGPGRFNCLLSGISRVYRSTTGYLILVSIDTKCVCSEAEKLAGTRKQYNIPISRRRLISEPGGQGGASDVHDIAVDLESTNSDASINDYMSSSNKARPSRIRSKRESISARYICNVQCASRMQVARCVLPYRVSGTQSGARDY